MQLICSDDDLCSIAFKDHCVQLDRGPVATYRTFDECNGGDIRSCD